jgi:hypothetical protein
MKELPMTDEHVIGRQPAHGLPSSWQRLVALSGIAFAVFLILAWFTNGAETPHYNAPDHDWTTWASNTEMKGRFAAFFALLAGLVFLPFAATIRDVLGKAAWPQHASDARKQLPFTCAVKVMHGEH